MGVGAGRGAACSSDSSSAVPGLVITHVISHYCFLVQHQRAAEGRPGGPVDGGGGVDGRGGRGG